MSDFLELVKIKPNLLPLTNGDNIFFGGEKSIKNLIGLYLKNKGIENYEKNAERFKINCILGNNGGGKSRILSEILPYNENNLKWHDYRGYSDFTEKYNFILDDFFKLSPNFKKSINSSVLDEGNFNKFYFDLLLFINSSSNNKMLIENFLNINYFGNYNLSVEFNLGNICHYNSNIQDKTYNFNDIDISLLLDKCDFNKRKILILLYLYVKTFLDFYHFDFDEDIFYSDKDKIVSKLKEYEKKYNIKNEDSIIDLLPSSLLEQDIDYSDLSQKICDKFCDIYSNDNNDCLNIEKEFIKIDFGNKIYLEKSEYKKILDFINLYGEVNLSIEDLSFSKFSAGEKMILTRFTNIYIEILNSIEIEKEKRLYDPILGDFIILIDEPDLHLHLEWQKKYIMKLIDVFSSLPLRIKTVDEEKITINLHFILATHSPFIISDLPIDSIIKLEKTNEKVNILTYDGVEHNNFKDINSYQKHFTEKKGFNTFGANYIDIINNGFFFKENNVLIGDFSENVIYNISNQIKIISLLESIEYNDENKNLIKELLKKINNCNLIDEFINENYVQIIADLKNKYYPLKDLIGDNFIKDNLLYL